MGFEGANVIFDSWVHPLMMGLEEHLLGMFREDFEFHGDAQASHLGHGAVKERPETQDPISPSPAGDSTATLTEWTADWLPDAEAELKKIPFFVRGKARKNTELYAREKGISPITLETLYDAKAHFGR